ncbi:MAG: 2OG-Fe(II) oxygenase, partial [Sandaracinaceae bacterium]
MTIRALDTERLAHEFRTAKPFPHCAIDGFLEPELADELARAYPSFETAESLGYTFKAVNEYRKIQITDSAKFPAPVQRLNEALASESFMKDLSVITGIDSLVYDEKLSGGGMHMTGAHGHLDVHVDFNWNDRLELHRRLNLLVYLNPGWRPEYYGAIELW